MTRFGRIGVAAGVFALSLGIVADVGAVEARADPTVAIAQVRTLATRVYAAGSASTASDAHSHFSDAATAKAIADLQTELNALMRAARSGGFADDAAFTRKWRQVAHLVDNLERGRVLASSADFRSVLPQQRASARRQRVVASGDMGARCSEALALPGEREFDVALADAGRSGSELWLRVEPDALGAYRLGTGASSLDTELTLFADTCPQSDAEAVARNDDAFGLAASVAIDARSRRGVWFARLRNLGRAGTAFVALDASATIAGHISDQRNDEPVSADVQTLTADGLWGYGGFSGQDGNYLLYTDPGTYYVFADGYADSYVSELYPDTPCARQWTGSCPIGDAQALSVAANDAITGIDIALNIGGRIAGVVRDRASAAPISGASVSLYDANGAPTYGSLPYPVTTDAAGRYTVEGLLTGSYYVQADANPYGSQLWSHVDCAGSVQQACNPIAGTPVSVVRDELTSAIDFDLPRQATIHAVLTQPSASSVYWTLFIYDEAGGFVSSVSQFNAVEAVSGPLTPGSYFAIASAQGYFPQLWNGIDCAVDCISQLNLGEPIAVVRGQQGEATFALHPFPSVSGRVTDAASNAPVADAQISLLDPQSFYDIADAVADADGSYTLANVPPGSYYVWVLSPTHLDAIYPAAPCQTYLFPGCDLSDAVLVTPSQQGGDISGIDVALQPNGSIAGRLQLRVPAGVTTLLPTWANVRIFDVQGRTVAQTSTLPDGTYTARDIPAGTFYAQSIGTGLGQVYDDVDCAFSTFFFNCDPTIGTPIVLGQGEQVEGIDFHNLPLDTIFGRVTGIDGQAVANVAIDLWSRNDMEHRAVATTNADGYYALQGADNLFNGNTYLVSTDVGGLPFDNQAYDGIACPMGPAYLGLCSLTDATPIGGSPAALGFVLANFSLHTGTGTLFRNGFDP
jgi:protocatechuate 3,4-dioxygenase beta subunit